MKIIVSMVVGVILAGFLFLEYHPDFGGKLPKEKIQTFSRLPNFYQNKFVNQIPTPMNLDIKTLVSIVREFIKGNPKAKPDKIIPVMPVKVANMLNSEETRVTWLGHSTVLLEMEGKRVLLDPMFSMTPSPVPLFGGKRYSETLAIEVEDLPPIDVVIVSHDHYDHLDYGSIMKLKDKVGQFCVPLGVGSHLERWGIDSDKIKEHNWWEESEFAGLRFVSAPARHFSGRRLLDRNSTLWCSWAIIGKHSKIYFSGDSGYGPHFKVIGEKYGPFDLTLIECGQYNERWSAIHMMPEESAQAHLDVRGKIMIPIHWAAFTLALHDWTDPIQRVTKSAAERGILISTPKIGETVVIGAADYPRSTWWR